MVLRYIFQSKSKKPKKSRIFCPETSIRVIKHQKSQKAFHPVFEREKNRCPQPKVGPIISSQKSVGSYLRLFTTYAYSKHLSNCYEDMPFWNPDVLFIIFTVFSSFAAIGGTYPFNSVDAYRTVD